MSASPAETLRRGFAKSFALNLLAKAVAFAQSIVVAFLFGATQATDGYFFLLNISLIVVGYISSVSSSLAMPRLMRQGASASTSLHARFVRALLAFVGVTALVAVAFLGVVSSVDPRFSLANPEGFALLVAFCACLPLLAAINVTTDYLSNLRVFWFSAATALLNSSVALVLTLSLASWLGVMALAVALICSSALNLLVLASFLYWHRKSLRSVAPSVGDQPPSNLGRSIVLLQLGNITSSVKAMLASLLLSASTGLLSLFNYAQRLSELPNSFILSQLGNVAGVKMNELARSNAQETLAKTFYRFVEYGLLVFAPISAVFLWNSSDVVELLYQKSSLSTVQRAAIADILRVLALISPFVVVSTLATRLAIALLQVHRSSVYQIAVNALTIGGMVGVVAWWGPQWFPACVLGASLLDFAGDLVFFPVVLKLVRFRVVALLLAKIVGLALVAYGLAEVLARLATPDPLLRLLATGLIGSAAYVAAVVLLRVSPEFVLEARGLVRRWRG